MGCDGITDTGDEVDVFTQGGGGVGRSDGAGAQVPGESMCCGSVGDFACADGGVDDLADGVNPVCKAVSVVEVGFESELHASTQVDVLGDLSCEGREDRCQLLCCCTARTGRCVSDGFVDGSLPVREELVADPFFGWKVVVHRAFGEFSV